MALTRAVRFMPAMPAREALALGWVMVAPSRAESLPYVVLEAAAAGKPLITTKSAAFPEIYGPLSDTLVPPLDAPALARAIARALDHPKRPPIPRKSCAIAWRRLFSVDTMVDGVLSAYAAALEALHQAGRR